MIQFNKLEFVTSTTLHINASVQDLSYYTNVYIDKIVIDTEDTVCPTGPSDNPPVSLSVEDTKSIDMIIDVSDATKKGAKMLFVYVGCSGVPAATTPCGLDSEYSLKLAVDFSCIYKEGLKKAGCTKGCGCIGADCEIDVAFANFALQYFRLTTAIENDDVENAYDAWCLMTYRKRRRALGKNAAPAVKGCGCNG